MASHGATYDQHSMRHCNAIPVSWWTLAGEHILVSGVVQAILIQCWRVEERTFASLGLQLSFMDDHFKPFDHLFASVHLYGAILLETIDVVIVIVGIALVFALNSKHSVVIFVHEVEVDVAMLGVPAVPMMVMS